MDPSVHPNLNAAVYRNMTAADRPPVPDKHLQFIEIYNDESAILGGSNMTNRYWRGTIWYYTNITDFDREKAFLAIKTESGICDGAYLEQDKFIIGEDSGVLQIIGVDESSETKTQELQCLGYACQHDDSLLTLSVTSDKSHVVTGGMDYCLKVWDIAELIATYSFGYAHTDIITSVATKPQSNSEFVSVSLDCEALMWDIRQSKPAKKILKNSCGFTSTSWNTNLDHMVAIGTRDGKVSLLDTRNIETPIQHDAPVFSRAVHRLSFNSDSEGSAYLAGCCDDITVKVLNVNKGLTLAYENEKHSDFVRGLSWYKNDLYSCSWDNTVMKHVMNSENDHHNL